MNLDGFAVLCRIADTSGVNLWRYRTPRGIGIEKAFSYLMPYVQHPETWRKQQISAYSADGSVFLGLAGVGLHSEEMLRAYRALPRSRSPWVQFVDLVVRTA
jgi:hypothetical protein